MLNECHYLSKKQLGVLNYLIIVLLVGQQALGQDHTRPQLNGVGMVQSQNSQNGIWGVSLAGGAEIFIYGQKLSMTPSKNVVQFTVSGTSTPITCPPLSSDNEFKSNTGVGKLQYSTPSLATLFNQPIENFNSVDSMAFFVTALGLDSTGTTFNNLLCPNQWDCSIVAHRTRTPVLYYISPPVVYHGAMTALIVDPKWSLNLQNSGDWPFTEARIDNHTIDFQSTVNGDTVMWGYQKNQVLGMVGDQPPSNSSQVNMKFAAGYTLIAPNTNIHCTFDNSKCYNVKTVAKIDSISAQAGYTSGGQLLTLKGFGLNGDTIDVTVDGVSCKVQSKSRTQITCITGPKASESINNTDTVGQHGLRRRIYNNTAQTATYIQSVTQYPFTEVLAMHLESAQDNATYYGNAYSGWFKAPTTTNYKFYMSCDDGCELRMGSANMSSANPNLILSNSQAVVFRNYWDFDGKLNTDWIPLIQDTYYFIEAKHVQGGGAEHVSVAVEIQGAVANHPNSKREVQRLQISPTILRDLINITINSPDTGSYILQLQNPGATTFTSVTVQCSATPSEMRNALQGFFWFYYSAYISVTKIMVDANGSVTASTAKSVQSIWQISVNKALTSVSITKILPKKVSTNSTIQILVPALVQVGNPPISGSFIIQCFKSDGTSNQTIELASNAANWLVLSSITDACTEYRDAIDIWEGQAYSGQVNDGRDIFLKFSGVNHDVPQFKILSGSKAPIIANNPQYNSLTTAQYGGSIFYEPIPFELLFTNETLPQVIVTVDSLPAVCAGLSCQYSYISTPASISSFSLSGNQLTIQGSSLPQSLQSITYSNAQCDIDSKSDTSIICIISPSAVSGDWIPLVKDAFGLVPVTAFSQVLGVTVNSVSPSTGLNPSGKTQLTITGSNFPQSTIDGNLIRIKFSDSTQCDVKSSSSATITCLTRTFSSASRGQLLTLTVEINGQSDSTNQVAVSSSQSSITAIIPNTASPVLKANLTIQVESTYTSTLSVSDLSVRLISTTDSDYFKQANVIDVDNTLKQITIKFGGAPSGTYSLEVQSVANGLFNTAGVVLTTLGAITSYSPSTGSVYGGQLVTITGQVFSSSVLDNEVLIGGVNCDVVQSSANQIQCRTGVRKTYDATNDLIIVSLKASEEAKCQAGDCKYGWTTANVPTLTDFTTQFDQNLKQHTISFSGSGFNGDTQTVQLYIDNILQTVTSVTSTSVTATIVGINGTSSTNIHLYFPIGSPAGFEILARGIKLTPSLVSLSSNIGSPAGSLITATVSGIGLGLVDSLSLLSTSGVALCSSITIKSYSQIECKTIAASYSSPLTIEVIVGGIPYYCQNLDTSKCQYSTDSTFPLVASAAVSTDYTRMEFSGTNFFTTGYIANATFFGVQADSVTVVSSSSAYATYTHGVPATTIKVVPPSLVFINTASKEAHWANNVPSLANTYIASNTASTVSCSFSGGCLLSVSGHGLASSLRNSAVSNITVCGKLCVLSEDDSTTSTAACYLPAVPTQYSISNFNITLSSDISNLGTTFSSNPLYTYTLFDGNNMNGWPSTTKSCFIGVSYPSTYVGILSQFKFYMNAFTPLAYVNNLFFQGSNDGVSYTTIKTIGEEIHTGWNYYDFKQDGTQPMYQYYRLFGAATGSCVIGELVLKGQVAINDNSANYGCTPQLTLNGTTSSTSVIASYQGSITPLLKSITPRFGTVKGGTSITFTGTGFSSDSSKYTILVDGIACIATTATTTSVTCTSGKRPGLFPTPTLSINIAGQGKVSTQGLTYLYANLWSDTTTWGGEFQPMEGESVYIPAGLNLLVDIDSTPVLNAVLVEGSLIFPPDEANPSHQRTFDAGYVFVDGGYMEVGTEQFPYTSRLTITMHGTKQSPEIPIYGNKVIGVRNGILDLHGVARSPTWTELLSTVNPGDSSLTLNTGVDWKAGEKIVIASTSLNAWEAEQVTIVQIDSSNANYPIVTFSPVLQYKHYAAVETYGSQSITMRAEVGLLTRNVVFRGDPETSSNNLYGAHIMLHSMGDESLIGRIENIECFDVGQAFQLGRYPLHFHMIGTVHQSYIKGNSIHQTYNRAVTFHGVHFLRVIQNVAYNVMGHTFFVEDAIETNNLLDGNLVILTKRSWSLLNTDQTPASFWVTNPYNIFRNNHAAGSDRYGFWFDLQPHPTGPSYDATICPDHMPLGEFKNNFAHSNGLYGIWIFHKHIPSTYPCSPTAYDSANTTDPYWKNPPVTANYDGFTTYSNGEVGLMFEEVGDVRINNAYTADNLVAGIEISIVSNVRNGKASVNGALIVGYSQNTQQIILDSKCWGLITSRSDYLSVNKVSFYRLDQPGMAGLGSCSHCFHPAATDSGARTVTFSELSFDSTVPAKINYQLPWRDIFYDLDGSLTGLGPRTWATNYNWEHNNQPECKLKMSEYNGYICDSSIEIRRIAFWNYKPDTFRGMQINVIKYEDSLISGMDNVTLANYLLNYTAYSVIPFKPKSNPMNGWAVPFVTKHKYKVHWAFGLDFNQMQCDISDQWVSTDHDLNIVFNFTEARARVNFTTGKYLVPNETLITKANALLQSGDNIVYNDTSVRQIQFVVNGKNSSRTSLFMTTERCAGSCFGDVGDINTENGTRYWSNTTSWPKGVLPVEGEDIVIDSTWNMILDLPITPVLSSLEINGVLTFKPSMNITLQSKIIFVRGGILNVGSPDSPYDGIATILLYGEQSSQTVVYSDNIDTGNKMLANTGRINMYGQQRKSRVSRLLQTANIGDTQIKVELGLDWTTNDQIAIAANTMNYKASDSVKILSYNPSTGIAVVDQKLSYYHWGALSSTGSSYNGVDMRAEVVLLTRNVVIRGTDTQGWGCQFLTSDFIEASGRPRYGRSFLDNVEIRNCSQFDNGKAAIRFQGAQGGYSLISNCAIHHGLGWGFNIETTANVILKNNVFYSFQQFGGLIQTSDNLTIDSNIILHVEERTTYSLDHLVDKSAGICICSYVKKDKCTNVMVTNNIVAGTFFYGYTAPGHTCGNYSDSTFKNNVAHSIWGSGAYIFADANRVSSSSCLEGSFFTAYKCTQDGVITFDVTQQAIFSYMTLIDNSFSAVVNLGFEADSLLSNFRHSLVYGETEAKDCPSQNYCTLVSDAGDGCVDKVGFMVPYFQQIPKDIFPSMKSQLPVHKIKNYAAWGGNSQVQNVTFSNFRSNGTFCGGSQSVFSYGTEYADYVPPSYYSGITFVNVEDSALVYLYSPPSVWAVVDDCGEFPCTAPKNGLMSFEKVKYSGDVTPNSAALSFQIVANNPTAARAFKGCTFVEDWNAYRCANDYLGLLLFESVDDDKEKRTFSPMVITSINDNYQNTLNEFMDHIWDSFYTGQLRLARFPGIIQTGTGANTASSKLYNISYTGTPPGSQRFKLIAQNGAVTVSIRYPKAGTYSVSDVNGNVIAQNAWDDKLSAPSSIKGRSCGENRFVGIVNILEFYITPGCLLQINPVNSISGRIRLAWTVEAFYSSGSSNFIDRFASVLNIPASSIKIVSVYQGSVQIVYSIADITSNAVSNLQAIQTKIANLIANSGFASKLGAPVLDGDFGDTGSFVKPGVTIIDSNTNPDTTKDTTTKNDTNVNNGGNSGGDSTTQSGSGDSTTTSQSSGGLSSSSKLAIIISLVVLFIIVAIVVGVFVYKKHKSDQQGSVVKQSDFASSDSNRPAGDNEDDVYEPQYHPKAELGSIFGAGYDLDKIKKMNQEDNLNGDEEQSPDKLVHETDGGEDMINHSRTEQSMVAQSQMHNDQSHADMLAGMVKTSPDVLRHKKQSHLQVVQNL